MAKGRQCLRSAGLYTFGRVAQGAGARPQLQAAKGGSWWGCALPPRGYRESGLAFASRLLDRLAAA